MLIHLLDNAQISIFSKVDIMYLLLYWVTYTLTLLNYGYIFLFTEINSVELTFEKNSEIYVEDSVHTFVFDVAIAVADSSEHSVGADDAATNRWALEITIFDDTNTPVKVKTLTKGNGLTPAQADLLIRAGEIGIMEDVEWTVDMGSVPCPTTSFTFQVELVEGAKTPATAYTLSAAGGVDRATTPLDLEVPPSLQCRGM